MSITIDESRLQAFSGLLVNEVGAALNAALVVIGDELGLYRAMADAQPVGAAELAARTGTQERYVREWLSAQAASAFVLYDPAAERYTLPLEHALVLADESGPLAKAGIFQAAAALIDGRDRVIDRFRSGGGVGWHEHRDGMFCGTERAFASTYRAFLLDAWLPALDGAVERLQRGARVADVGCGHGASTILMAQAFPASRFAGFDSHEASIAIARERARAAGVGANAAFEVAGAQDFPGEAYELLCFFDALHDMGDPVGAARRARAALAPGGVCMVVEPYAGDRLEDNLNPVGRMYYGFSTLACTPGALAQPGGAALGTQAGEARLREVLLAGGFSCVRRVAETPLNIVLEARP
jgi:SAM-dependent methyltransferase